MATSWKPGMKVVHRAQRGWGVGVVVQVADEGRRLAVRFAGRDGLTVVSGRDFSVRLDKMTGAMASYTFRGRELIASGPEPNFWRAPTDNDFGNGMPRRLGAWRRASLEREPKSLGAAREAADRVAVTAVFELEGVAVTHTVRYTISADGGVTIANEFAPRAGAMLPDLPRVGMRLAVPGAFDRVQWFGRGPQENYRDRNTAAFVGLYEAAAGDENIPYVAPRSTGTGPRRVGSPSATRAARACSSPASPCSSSPLIPIGRRI